MHPRRRELLALSGAALAGLSGCLSDLPGGGQTMDPSLHRSDVDRETDPGVPAADREALVRGNTAFGLALHDHLVEQSPGENLLVSPYSISVALAMTWAGARGETAAGMADALRFRLPEERLHPAFNDVDRRVEASDERVDTDGDGEADATPFTLETANSLWGQEGFPFADTFLDALAANYGAGLRSLEFAEDPEAARRTINDWVAERTEGTVEDLLPEGVVTGGTRLVLTNALYFRANWASTFDEDVTGDRAFSAVDGSESTVPTMRQSADLPYAEVGGARVVELPYVGEEVGMVLVLPPEGEFESFERSLSAARLHALFDAMEEAHGEVAVPKFTCGSKARLQDALSALGMSTAFDPARSDFGGMTDPPSAGEGLYLEDVVHETHVAVDEQGTEASAATGAVVAVVSYTEPQFEFVADRPFLYAVRHRPTDAVLFLGRVVDAGAAQG